MWPNNKSRNEQQQKEREREGMVSGGEIDLI